MGAIAGRQRYRDLFFGLALAASALALVVWPGEGVAAAREGLVLCANVIVPSLFPFFVLASLVVELGLSRYLGRLMEGIMRPLFRVNGACASALALGFVGGYPVGARTAIALYQNGQCSRTEAERLLAFCNNSGPAFILGVVGAGVFASGQAGLLLYLSHVAASLFVGILFRFYKAGEGPLTGRKSSAGFQAVSFPLAVTRSVTGGCAAILNICAFVVFFSVVLRLLVLAGVMEGLSGLLAAALSPLGVGSAEAAGLLAGLVELSSGVAGLRGGGLTAGRLSMAAFLLGWAGLSVHCQVLAFLGDCGLSMRTYFVGKLLHGICSAGLATLLARYFLPDQPVSSYLVEQVETLAALDFQRALTLSGVAAWGVWLAFVGVAAVAVKKNGGKLRRQGV